MPREVHFTIRSDGSLHAEFSGFPGEDCLTEAKALADSLSSLGLKLMAREIVMKTPAQIELELDHANRTGSKGQKAKVGHES